MKAGFIALALLAGCTSFSKLDPELAAMRGQPVSAAISRFGIPEREYDVVGSKAYEWKVTESPTLSCSIKVLAAGGIVQAAEVHGNNGTCYRFVK
jgi:hypothetical protein